jgi:hypothetical protein
VAADDGSHEVGMTLKYEYKGILGYDVLVLPKENTAGAQATTSATRGRRWNE